MISDDNGKLEKRRKKRKRKKKKRGLSVEWPRLSLVPLPFLSFRIFDFDEKAPAVIWRSLWSVKSLFRLLKLFGVEEKEEEEERERGNSLVFLYESVSVLRQSESRT